MADQRPEIRSIGSRLRLALLFSSRAVYRLDLDVSTRASDSSKNRPSNLGIWSAATRRHARLAGSQESEWDVSNISLALLAPGPLVSCLLIGDRGVAVWRRQLLVRKHYTLYLEGEDTAILHLQLFYNLFFSRVLSWMSMNNS
mgnify:CR=1 FL=1|jgi:hypothetical protein